MVTLTLRSPFCTRDFLIKYGITPNGKQRYRCQACSRPHREHPGSNAYVEAARAMILRAYEEWSRLWGLSRTFGVSRNTVSAWLKKSPEPGRHWKRLQNPVFLQRPPHARERHPPLPASL